MERKNAWKKYTEEEKAAVFAYGDEYRQFISDCKTERECVTELKKRAKSQEFILPTHAPEMIDLINSGRIIGK